MRKFNFLFVAVFLFIAGHSAVAQDEEISNEDLRRYALMMEVIEAMKDEISNVTNDMIREQEGMDGRRYMELAKAKGDEAKLDAMGAKEFEKKFMSIVTKEQEERKEAISDVVQILATKMLSGGGKTYKAIRDGLESNSELKARYDTIAAQMKLKEGA